MYCKDCGNKIKSWQEYCSRCGADLYKRENVKTTKEHTVFVRFFQGKA
jgi:predicted amidophosphoribosyltransferase